jgi:flagellar protein FlaG
MANNSIASITSLVGTSSGNSSEISVSRVREVETAMPGRQVSAIDHLGEMSSARAAAAEQVKVSRAAFERVVSELQNYVQKTQRNLDFHVDDQSGRVVVRVVDATSDEVIRQIPSEEMLSLSRRIQEYLDGQQPDLKGMLLEIKA